MRRSLTILSLLLCFAVVHSEHQREPKAQGTYHLFSRRERIFKDIGVAFSGLVNRRRHSNPRKLVKRDETVLPGTQCSVKRVEVFTTTTTTATICGETCISTSTASETLATSTNTSSSVSRTSKRGRAASSPTSTTSATASPTSTSTSTTTPRVTSTPAYEKVFDSSGSGFFDDWDFFSAPDPTHGAVQYTTQGDAEASGLIDVDSDGYANIRVETTPVIGGGERKSVRIESKQTFTGGLWVLDALHMPTGCGTWPAWWTHGPDWPQNGEIDILEGVNSNQWNQAALHVRDAGCSLDADFGGTGNMIGTVCMSGPLSNAGCGIQIRDTKSYGAGFNSNGGGVYAMLWDTTGIFVWFFPRGTIPKDLNAGNPDPSSWATPFASFPASTCDPFTYNQNHKTILDTTLCGDWANGAWNVDSDNGGQNCAAQTGYATCPEYVQNNGDALSEAYWQIKSVKIYQPTA